MLIQEQSRAQADRMLAEVFVHRMIDPAPERVLEGITDMICRYIFLEENP